jgi:hypothetical protein
MIATIVIFSLVFLTICVVVWLCSRSQSPKGSSRVLQPGSSDGSELTILVGDSGRGSRASSHHSHDSHHSHHSSSGDHSFGHDGGFHGGFDGGGHH